MNLDEVNRRHEEQRRRLAGQQADELHRLRLHFQDECDRKARIGVFRVAAALHHGITCAEVTPAQIQQAMERTYQFTMPQKAGKEAA